MRVMSVAAKLEPAWWEPDAPIGARIRDHAMRAVHRRTGRAHWFAFDDRGYAACGRVGRSECELRGSMDARWRRTSYCRTCARVMTARLRAIKATSTPASRGLTPQASAGSGRRADPAASG